MSSTKVVHPSVKLVRVRRKAPGFAVVGLLCICLCCAFASLLVDISATNAPTIEANLGKATQHHTPYFSANGFQYCSNLNNALFHRHTTLDSWPNVTSETTSAELNPSQTELASFLDQRACNINNCIHSVKPGLLDVEQTRRLACYLAADGTNHMANLSNTRFYYNLNRFSYFGELLPAIIPNPLSPVRKYKVAFFVMIHGPLSVLQNIHHLISTLNDGSAIILIHVDKRPESDDLRIALAATISSLEHVHLAKTSYKISWGHSSILHAQLNGFFELLDLAEWDHIINLSAYDIPLRPSKEIARILSQQKYAGHNFIDAWDMETTELGSVGSPVPRWKVMKHHQWGIFTREFIEYLRTTEEVYNALAWFEHTLIPDESFLGTVLYNTPRFRDRLSPSKRYSKWRRFAAHPEMLTRDMIISGVGVDVDGEEPKFLFIEMLSKLISAIKREPAPVTIIDADEEMDYQPKLGPPSWLINEPSQTSRSSSAQLELWPVSKVATEFASDGILSHVWGFDLKVVEIEGVDVC
ncbi:hypothetical protein BCR33DRAFT_795734 [Rhizoclosmatium globosum]|uniref:protein xylosyltransferase n=1 Tax=Rhizoclosmatium globosum TaxID=329046 RepID=A0A1Y2AQ23_9FUNG|nr:hypothetical protein BCR33DRAFT_795734 [Rhizoclosmatium globosum]|eukprot:ORY24641.1 hypothetical protein BCR33DRAFT_795734 [Rhizoclosmatium globosum]